jgi:hypothetical protein
MSVGTKSTDKIHKNTNLGVYFPLTTKKFNPHGSECVNSY